MHVSKAAVANSNQLPKYIWSEKGTERATMVEKYIADADTEFHIHIFSLQFTDYWIIPTILHANRNEMQ